jgi:hypothetical protein
MADDYREYNGHRIEVRERTSAPEREGTDSAETAFDLIIDGAPTEYGQLPDGTFYLEEYAYDPAGSLVEVASKYVDYRDRAERVGASRNGGE